MGKRVGRTVGFAVANVMLDKVVFVEEASIQNGVLQAPVFLTTNPEKAKIFRGYEQAKKVKSLLNSLCAIDYYGFDTIRLHAEVAAEVAEAGEDSDE